MYSHNFILKKSGHSEWTLFSEKGIQLRIFNGCGTADRALAEAKAWASSWTSISIRMEDEQDPKRD